jgi:periplasmic divalent cation tolerance protein
LKKLKPNLVRKMNELKIILTTIDNEQKAEEISNTLLKLKLAACINMIPTKSRYWWKSKIEKNNELTLVIKTTKDLVDKTTEKIKQIHTYELPVIEVINIEKVNEGVNEWVKEVCN